MKTRTGELSTLQGEEQHGKRGITARVWVLSSDTGVLRPVHFLRIHHILCLYG